MAFSRMLLFILIGIFVAQSVYYFTALPEKVASHFDGTGTPDGWMSRSGFIALEAIILAILAFQFLALPYLIEKLPNSFMNIPHKDHWLSDERRVETFAFMRRYLEWFAAVSLLLFILINQLVYAANIERQNLQSGKMWVILVGYFVFVAVWLVMFVRHFSVKT
jgi:uncharacterized membrane protein